MQDASNNETSEIIAEVCSSTASLTVSPSIVGGECCSDSHTVVSLSVSSQSSAGVSDQFDDAPEESSFTDASGPPPLSINPLDALALACATENELQTKSNRIVIPGVEDVRTTSFHISQNDVLCGRGGLTNHHPGNVFFRRLVRIKQEAYLKASKREKAGVAKEIVALIRNLQPSGRFLKKEPLHPGVWIEIGDRKAREKTSQALREGAPELREELNSDKPNEECGDLSDLPLKEDPLNPGVWIGIGDRKAHGETSQALLEGASEPSEKLNSEKPHERCLDLSVHPPKDEHSNPVFLPFWSLQSSTAIMATVPMEKPKTLGSNRIRVVSSDSNVGAFCLSQNISPDESLQAHVVFDDVTPDNTATLPQEHCLPYWPMPRCDGFPSKHQIFCQITMKGKRKAEDQTSISVPHSSSLNEKVARGPRLKLLKKRREGLGDS
jgi:hypothetical protein